MENKLSGTQKHPNIITKRSFNAIARCAQCGGMTATRMKMATTRGEKPRGPVKKKLVPQRRTRGFVNAPLTTVLRFIHSSAASTPPSAATLLPVQHVGSKGCFLHVHTHTRAMLAPVRALYTEDILHGYDEN